MKRNILLFTLTLLVNLSALSQAGTPDNSFGTNGRVNIPVGIYDDHAYAVAIQPDGKIVIAGPSRTLNADPNFGNKYDFVVVRLNPDGTLDESFDGDNNGNGKVTISVGDYGGFAHAMAIQPDGKILIAGYVNDLDNDNYDYVVVRLKTDGKLDTDFDGDGRAYISPSTRYDFCFAMALQADGKIVLAGQSITVTDRVFSVARLTNTGAPDLLFGNNNDGKALIPINGIGDDNATAVAIQPDGNILVAGSGATTNPELRHFAIARLTASGLTDGGFNTTGQTVLLTTNSSFCRAMALQPDGRILLAGGSGFTAATADFQIVRLTSNGSLDNSFDTDGRVLVPVGTGIDDASTMVLQTDGKIVVAGHSQVGSTYNFSTIRLNTNGTPDVCFDGDGKAILPSTTTSAFGERGRAIALQPDGKIVLAGINGQSGVSSDPAIDFIIMRLIGASGSAQDNDGDGFSGCVDCDDGNPNVHPGATEICNGIDDDCDGQVDEGLTTIFYRDFDGDGFGSSTNTIQACTVPAGYVTNNTDCDDTKILYVDNDGDGYGTGSPAPCGVENNTDCNDGNSNIHTPITYYQDADNDGFGNPNNPNPVCQLTPPTGYVSNNTDCDDTKPLYADNDADGYGAGSPVACGVATNTDCNDNDQTIHPGALENVCNGIDNDCDGQIDEDTPKFTYYFDGDGDQWGIASQTVQACALPQGYAVNPGDCNDINPTIYPGATEVCNGIDENCDGQIDEGAQSSWYIDNDGDGYGNSSQFVLACTQPAGYIANGGDCNDDPATGGASIHPGATEICNLKDDDCDGQVDEGFQTTWYIDNDGDGYGNPNGPLTTCTQPQGYVANNGDCNDNDVTVNPAAIERCNFKDDDCDGQVDEGFVTTTYYKDADGDGYGNASISVIACVAPPGYVTNNTDCDDGNDTIHPNATEFCNGIDENCNVLIDDNPVLITWYRDADTDGWGNPNVTVLACTPPPGYIREAFDCNDADAEINPEAIEISNDKDDDCDGQIDEGILLTFYRDADTDGFGDPANSTQAATQPAGYVNNNTDCNDNNAAINPNTVWYLDADNDNYYTGTGITQCISPGTGYKFSGLIAGGDCNDNGPNIHPGATEICNSIDDDCDGQVDDNAVIPTWYLDADNDNYYTGAGVTQCNSPGTGYKAIGLSGGGDCNDNNDAIHPNATEVCNGADDNCNGQIDEGVKTTFYRDADTDGFGDPNTTTQACTVPAGFVANNTDCNDNNAAINPNTVWYLDSDADNYYTGTGITQCISPGTGYKFSGLIAGGDCNDNNSNINPGKTEVCNGVDENCNGQVDEGVKITFYRDADTDGFGDPNTTTQACTVPAGYVTNNTDCNDNNAAINPNTIWYLDADNDNFYTGSGITQCISPGTGYKFTGLIASGDCNDGNASINPGATEICGNNADDNCNGQINEGCPTTPTLSINDVTVYESDGQAILTVSLSMSSTEPIKINYKTIDGTAKKPKDYKNINGSVTIQPGGLTTQIAVSIIQDNVTEGSEYFDVQISLPKINGQPQSAIIGDDVGRVTILDGVAPDLTKKSGEYPVIKKQSTGIEKFNVNITPNPTNVDFILNIQSSSTETANIRIFDSQGRLIKLIKNSSNNVRFGNELRAGVYLVEVRQGTNKKTIKVIKVN